MGRCETIKKVACPVICYSLLLAISFSCQRKETVVHFVIPKGSHGFFVVEEKRDAITYLSDGKKVVIEISASGKGASDKAVFDEWHSETAEYVGGEKILSAEQTAIYAAELKRPDIIRFKGLGCVYSNCYKGGRYWFCVGNKNEVENMELLWLKDKDKAVSFNAETVPSPSNPPSDSSKSNPNDSKK